MRRLQRLARPGTLEAVDFQQPGALDRFEGLTHAECMREMWLVTPDGRRFSGAEAVARALLTRPLLGAFAWLYYLPGLRQAADAIYRAVAARRYAIAGRSNDCESGTCSLHFPPPDEPD